MRRQRQQTTSKRQILQRQRRAQETMSCCIVHDNNNNDAVDVSLLVGRLLSEENTIELHTRVCLVTPKCKRGCSFFKNLLVHYTEGVPVFF